MTEKFQIWRIVIPGIVAAVASIIVYDQLNRSKKKSLENWMESWVNSKSFPCLSMSIISSGKEVFHYHYGYSNVNKKILVNRDSLYRIYSMTKPITTVCLLILVDRKLISLNDHVSKYIPAFKNMKVVVGGTVDNPILENMNESMTIHHLLTHTSGLSYGWSNSLSDQIFKNYFDEFDIDCGYRNYSLKEFVEKLANIPLSFQPGSNFLYGFSTDVIGHIIEIVSNMTLRDFMLAEIFSPLNMNKTDFFIPDTKDHDKLVQCYEHRSRDGYFESTRKERDRITNPIFYSGGGGLVSNLDDYIKFVNFLINHCNINNNPIISIDLFNKMTSNQLPNGESIIDIAFDESFSEGLGEGLGFGYGLFVITNNSLCKGGINCNNGEVGWGGIASTWFEIDFDRNCAVILMAQLTPSNIYPIRNQLRYLFHWFLGHKNNS